MTDYLLYICGDLVSAMQVSQVLASRLPKETKGLKCLIKSSTVFTKNRHTHLYLNNNFFLGSVYYQLIHKGYINGCYILFNCNFVLLFLFWVFKNIQVIEFKDVGPTENVLFGECYCWLSFDDGWVKYAVSIWFTVIQSFCNKHY